MRRRDYFRINVKTEKGLEPVVINTADLTSVVPARKLGQCSKCGKMVGRGLHFHTKACRGTMDLK